MPQTGLLTWSVLIFLDIFLILLGIYCAYKFIRAYLDGRDLIKYQGYLINAFLLIFVFPFLITFGGIKLNTWVGDKYSLIGIIVQTNDLRGLNDKISISSKDLQFKSDDKKIVDLNVQNDFSENKEFSINIHCFNSKLECDNVLDILIPKYKNFNIKPKFNFKLPISINIRENTPTGKYNFNITIKDETGTLYDSIPITISIG